MTCLSLPLLNSGLIVVIVLQRSGLKSKLTVKRNVSDQFEILFNP
jgi:hypothetical protein